MSDADDITPSTGLDIPSSDAATLGDHGGSAAPGRALPAVAGYVVEGELGRGGMGVVYRARQQGLDRVVALKMILHADHAGPAERQRFLREAESLAKLRHENIVQVYEVGEHEGKPFFSLEYVEGGSLDGHLRDALLPPRDAARLVQQLADAIQAAHDAGIIHRDLKPGNILLQNPKSGIRNPNEDRSPHHGAGTEAVPVSDFGFRISDLTPKVTDFGLAKKQDAGALSVSGAVMGTPSYMAPEQAAGLGHAIDARTDVYALGAILYECLTGRPPFRAATQVDTLLQVMTQEPVSPRTLQPEVPADLETVCLKCLHKEPARRYATARELANELGRFLRGEPVVARPVGRIERAWRWCRRNPTTAGLLATVAALLLAGTTVSTVLGLQAVAARADAELNAEQERLAREEVERSEHKLNVALDRERSASETAQRRLHVSRLSLVQSYWDEGNVSAALGKLDETAEQRHAWEHRYLYTSMYHRGQRILLGHAERAFGVSFSPDGKRLATGAYDDTVRVWDIATGQELQVLRGHTSVIRKVRFSPDGSRIVSASHDRTVKVWDAATGQPLHTLRGHFREVVGVCWSPDSSRIASVSIDGIVRLWDAGNARPGFVLRGHNGEVHDVCFSPDGTRVASAGNDRTVKVLDVVTGRELLTLRGHTDWVHGLCFSPDGKRIASGSSDRTVKVWDAMTGQELHSFQGHGGVIECVAYSPDGRWIASGGSDQELTIRAAATGKEALTLRGHTDSVRDVCFSPDGKRIATASGDWTVRLWDTTTAGPLTLRGHSAAVLSVSFSPDGKWIASAAPDRTARLWDVATGREIVSFRGHSDSTTAVSFCPDGKTVASGSLDRTVKLWDLEGRELATLAGHTKRITCVSFSPDGKRIVSASGDLDGAGEVLVWDVVTRQKRVSLKGHTALVGSVCFSPDGQRIASASWDRTARLWDAASGRELLTLQGHTGFVSGVCFSPDGKRIASSSLDNTVKVWDTRTGQVLLTLRGHTNWVMAVAYSPDGTRIVSASGDLGKPGEMKVWDAATGEEMLSLKGHTQTVASLSFSPDGNSIVTGSYDTTLKVWDASATYDLRVLRGHTSWVQRVSFTPDGKRLVSRDGGDRQITWDLASGQPVADEVERRLPNSPRSPDGRLFALPEGNVIRLHPVERVRAADWSWVDADYRWHEEQARDAWWERDWFSAAFHLARLSDERAWDAALLVQRAHALRQLGRQREADVLFVRALLLDPHVSRELPPSAPRPVMPRADD